MTSKPKPKSKSGPKAALPTPAPIGRLSEIEAAIEFQISPELLRYFTTHSVKSGDTRKLPVDLHNGARFYDPKELKAYDAYLRDPWPKTEKQTRPHLPDEIRKDIMDEARFACAACGHQGAGEAAHLVPVAEAHSHHPALLIWLCANHHTGIDKSKVPVALDLAEAKWLKQRLVERRMRLWTIEHAGQQGILQLIRLVASAQAALDDAKARGVYGGVAAIAQIDLDALGVAADQIIKEPQKPGQKPTDQATFNLAKTVKAKIKSVKVSDRAKFASTTDDLVAASSKFLRDTGQVECPVCHGSGIHGWRECIPCEGSGVMDKHDADKLDVSSFDLVDCPVCHGKGHRKGEDCPVCAGHAQLLRRQADVIEPREYEEVDCPLCKGSGVRDHQDCPACNGDRTMERWLAEQVDVSLYGREQCPLCEGTGQRNHNDCPFCGGEGEVENRRAEQFDPQDYETIRCKLCKGRGHWKHFDPCVACGGEGELERNVYDRIDWSDFDEVDCPRCNGKGIRHGDDCRSCGGEGTILRRHRDQLS